MISTLDRQVEQKLLQHAIRYTEGRRAVVSALSKSDGPRSAAEIHTQIADTVPLSSLYRTLTTLEEAEILSPHYSLPGVTRYELAEWLTGHHHHLVCIDCGQVEDIETEPALEKRLQRIVNDVASGARFKESNHALEIEGLCQKCA
jgi:Fur family transcriptional regulator, ferric uptake regulator